MKDMKVCYVFNAIYVYPVNTKHKKVYAMYEATQGIPELIELI